MTLSLVTAPAEEPLSLAETKLHLRVDQPEEDAWITQAIISAREAAETRLSRQLVTATLLLTLDSFAACPRYRWVYPGELEISWPKVQSVAWIKYYDADGALQTLDPSLYQADIASEPARLRPAPLQVWPETQNERIAAVQIQFVAGYGAAADVPAGLKKWLLAWIDFHYAHRGDENAAWPDVMDGQLDPYRWTRC